MNKTAVFPVATNDSNVIKLSHNKIYDILYSPNDHQCIALDKKAFDDLKEIETALDEKAKKLTEASTPDEIQQAQQDVRQQLFNSSKTEINPDDPKVNDLSPLVTGSNKFLEVIRFGEKKALTKYSLVPTEFFEGLKKRQAKHNGPNLFFNLPKDITGIVKEVAKHEPTGDTLRGWRYTNEDESQDPNKKSGQLDPAKVKDSFNAVKVSIKKEWKIVDTSTTGQISSRLFTRFIPGLHEFLNNDDFDMIDKWVAHINTDANTSARQYEKYRTEIFAELDKVDSKDEKDSSKLFLPEDWDKVKRLVKDTWGEKSTIFIACDQMHYAEVNKKSKRKPIRDQILNTPLPPTRWDGSAGAQLMRYSLGGSVKAEFDLLAKGRLALTADAKFDATLAEAKAEGSVYFPNSEGYPLKPTVMARIETLDYQSNDSTYTNNDHAPYFAVNCSMLTPVAACSILANISGWEAVQKLAERAKFSPETTPVFVQVVGHTSAPGDAEFNKKLGLRRAAVVANFLKHTHLEWLNHFKNGTWNEADLEFMAYTILILSSGIKLPDDFNWEIIGSTNEHTHILDQLKQALPQLETTPELQSKTMQNRLFIPRADWYKPYNTNNRSSHVSKLENVVTTYLGLLRQYAKKITKSNLNTITLPLYSTPFISKGETHLKIKEQTEKQQNRRCEFVAWELVPTIKEGPCELKLGELRCQIHGHMGAWAGANLQLGAKIAIAAPQGTLAVMAMSKEYKQTGKIGDSQYKAKAALEAEAVAEAFLGAKAEAGLKAGLDWRKPQQSTDVQPNNWGALGSIGYTVTALAGIGGTGEFKVGFDTESQRFVLRVHAEAALGAGIGGQLDIVVGLGQCYDFIQLIHNELERNHFNYLDIFENTSDGSKIDVFQLFSAWSWKLMQKGIPAGGALLVAGYVAETSIDILKSTNNLIKEWESNDLLAEQVNSLTDTLQQDPSLIKFLTPEAKGRILFDLISKPKDLGDYWDSIANLDYNNKREEACKNLLIHGIKSSRDWQETLEHMGEIRNGTLQPNVSEKADPKDKAERLKQNEELLKQTLLSDDDDWQEVHNTIEELKI